MPLNVFPRVFFVSSQLVFLGNSVPALGRRAVPQPHVLANSHGVTPLTDATVARVIVLGGGGFSDEVHFIADESRL